MVNKKKSEKIYCPRDNLIASEVGRWAKDKHRILAKYVDISHQARKKYITTNDPRDGFRGGATYIDLFCGPGRSKIKKSDEWIDGSAVIPPLLIAAKSRN